MSRLGLASFCSLRLHNLPFSGIRRLYPQIRPRAALQVRVVGVSQTKMVTDTIFVSLTIGLGVAGDLFEAAVAFGGAVAVAVFGAEAFPVVAGGEGGEEGEDLVGGEVGADAFAGGAGGDGVVGRGGEAVLADLGPLGAVAVVGGVDGGEAGEHD